MAEFAVPAASVISMGEAGKSVTDRRETKWLEPQFIVQMIVLIVGVIVASQVRTSGLELAAANLNEKATRIESQVGSVANSVQTMSTQNAELRAIVAAQAATIQDMKDSQKLFEARIIVLEKANARSEARDNR